jgi:hypothetical protein
MPHRGGFVVEQFNLEVGLPLIIIHYVIVDEFQRVSLRHARTQLKEVEIVGITLGLPLNGCVNGIM